MSDNPYKDQVKRYKQLKVQIERAEMTLSKMSDCYVDDGQNKHADFLFNLYKLLEAFQASMKIFRIHMMEGDKTCLTTEFSENSAPTPEVNLTNCEASLQKG